MFLRTGSKRTVVTLLLIAVVVLGYSALARAQEEPEAPGWSEPRNVSQSGAASAPQAVPLDDDLLLLWRDALDGFGWTRGGGEEWQTAATGEFPFATRSYYPDLQPDTPTPYFTPVLAAGGGRVHAIWRAEDGLLYYSSVPAAEFGDFDAWESRQPLGTAAAAALTVDGAGRVHVAYAQAQASDGSPAGLYHRRSEDGGASWSDPQLLYTSPYFRLLSPENANVQIAAGANDHVYVAADDHAREQILLARSTNGGGSWLEAIEVDRRRETDSSSATGPGGVRLGTSNGTVHLTWQAGHEGFNCAQYHRWSGDGGETWQPELPARVLDSLGDCPDDAQLLVGDGQLLLLALTEGGSYVSLWQEDRWSDPQLQAPLRGFTDAETFRQVQFTCGEDAIIHGGQLLVASCGEGATQDIWLLQRPLPPLVEALTTTPVWRTPAVVSGSQAADEEDPDSTAASGAFASPVLLADEAGRFHAFWSEAEAGGSAAPFAPRPGRILYARYDGERWSRPVAVVQAEGGAVAETPDAALTQDGRLLLVWGGNDTGDILYSYAAADRATAASEWTEPQPLPGSGDEAAEPDIFVDQHGAIRVVYAVPLNEGRGIYLTTSSDGGESWSAATQIFDAADAGWEMVGAPQLALFDTDHLHLLWQQQSLPQGAPDAALYFARSEDGGESWSEPQQVENGTPQSGPVVWSALATPNANEVHRVWQEWDGSRLNLWHQFSTDAGLSWNRAARVGGLGQTSGPAALVQDAARRLHLLQVAAESAGAGSPGLQHWLWLADEARWESSEPAPLDRLQLTPQGAVAAAITRDGALAALVTEQAATLTSVESAQPVALFTERTIDLPEEMPPPPPTLTPTPSPTPGPTGTPLPQATATPVFSTAQTGSGQLQILPSLGMNSLLLGGLVALIPAALVVVLVVGVYLRRR